MHEHLDKKPVPNSVPELVKGPSPSLSPYRHPRNGAKKRLLRYETT